MSWGNCFLKEKGSPCQATATTHGGLLGIPGNFHEAKKHRNDDPSFFSESDSFILIVPCEAECSYGASRLPHLLIVGKNGPADHLKPQIGSVLIFSHIPYRIPNGALYGPQGAL